MQVCPDPLLGLQVLPLLGSSSSLFVVSLAPSLIRDLVCYSRKCHKGEPSKDVRGQEGSLGISAKLWWESASPKRLQDPNGKRKLGEQGRGL